MQKYRALTISQPWADRIRRGDKIVENRRWATSYRGAFAVHAGKGTQYLTRDELAGYDTGAVVAIAELVACLELAELRKLPRDLEIEGTRYTVGQILDHRYTEGPFLWVLDRVQPIKPVPVRGAQGLWIWTVDPSAVETVSLAS